MKPAPIADYNNLSVTGQQMVYANTRAVTCSSLLANLH